jgi:putative transcriptional regulator
MELSSLEPIKSDSAYLSDLGNRIARLRLNQNMSQKILSHESGVSLPTLQRIEQGKSIQLSNFIRILRALKIAKRLEILAPEIPPSPLQQAALEGKRRKRASVKTSIKKPATEIWTWGDDR